MEKKYRSSSARLISHACAVILLSGFLQGCDHMGVQAFSGGVATGGNAPAAQPDPAQQEAERLQREIAQKRSHAVNALTRALADFVHRCAMGSLSAPNSPALAMSRRIADMRDRMNSAADGDVPALYDQTRILLNQAYPEAVNCGAVSPVVYGQRNADETWWFISSP